MIISGNFVTYTKAITMDKALGSIALCLGFFPVLWGQADYESIRMDMVRNQLEARDISDPATLKAMRKVPRHLFVPESARGDAYGDRPLSIGEGQTISQPYIVAFMTQALRLEASDRVLEIGTGSGYQAAVLAELADTVRTIEIVEPLAVQARDRLKDLGYSNVRVRIGDGYNGWPEAAPFDAIMVTAGAESIPKPLTDQLAVGGRLVIPVGPHRGVRDLLRLTKGKNGKLKQESLMKVRFVPFTRD